MLCTDRFLAVQLRFDPAAERIDQNRDSVVGDVHDDARRDRIGSAGLADRMIVDDVADRANVCDGKLLGTGSVVEQERAAPDRQSFPRSDRRFRAAENDKPRRIRCGRRFAVRILPA